MKIGSPSGVKISNSKPAVKRAAITPLIIVALLMDIRLLSLLSIQCGG
jgi:hypothetical protein